MLNIYLNRLRTLIPLAFDLFVTDVDKRALINRFFCIDCGRARRVSLYICMWNIYQHKIIIQFYEIIEYHRNCSEKALFSIK